MSRGYYDPVGRSVRALLVISLVCFGVAAAAFILDVVTPGTIDDTGRPLADLSSTAVGFGVFALVAHFATAAITAAIRSRGQ